MDSDQESLKQAGRLYAKYGKPLEADHWGEFVAIFPDGTILVGPDLEQVKEKAAREIGEGAFFFKLQSFRIGPRLGHRVK